MDREPFDHRITQVAIELYRYDYGSSGRRDIDVEMFNRGGQQKYFTWAKAVLSVVDSFPPVDSTVPARIDISIIPMTGEISAHTHSHPFNEWGTKEVEIANDIKFMLKQFISLCENEPDTDDPPNYRPHIGKSMVLAARIALIQEDNS